MVKWFELAVQQWQGKNLVQRDRVYRKSISVVFDGLQVLDLYPWVTPFAHDKTMDICFICSMSVLVSADVSWQHYQLPLPSS